MQQVDLCVGLHHAPAGNAPAVVGAASVPVLIKSKTDVILYPLY
jgi:hypothetical protein